MHLTTAGPLINRLSDFVNRLEAIRVLQAKGGGNSIQLQLDACISENGEGLMSKVIEACGNSNDISPGEMTMIIDLCLGASSLSIECASSDLALKMTDHVASVLCLLITSSLGSTPEISTIRILYYCTISSSYSHLVANRALHLVKAINPNNSSSTNIWQCIIRFMTKTGSLDDEGRLSLFNHFIHHLTMIDEVAMEKWIKLLTALLRILRHVFQRKGISEAASGDIISLIEKGKLPLEATKDLLNIPLKFSLSSKSGSVESLRSTLETLDLCIGSLGHGLKNLLSVRQISLSEVFSLENITASIEQNFCTWPRDLRLKNNESFLRLAITPQKSSASLIPSLCSLIATNFWNTNKNTASPLIIHSLSSLLRRTLISQENIDFCNHFPFFTQMVLIAHSPKKLLNTKHTIFWKRLSNLLDKMIATEQHVSLFYWPLRALGRIALYFPQPSRAQFLLKTIRHISNHFSDLKSQKLEMQNVIINLLRVSFRFLDPLLLQTFMEIIDLLPKISSLDIIMRTIFITNDSIILDQLNAKAAIIFASCINSSITKILSLKKCEVFLRHSKDICIFEKDPLVQYQAEILNFIQRSLQSDTISFDKEYWITFLRHHISSEIMESNILLPPIKKSDQRTERNEDNILEKISALIVDYRRKISIEEYSRFKNDLINTIL